MSESIIFLLHPWHYLFFLAYRVQPIYSLTRIRIKNADEEESEDDVDFDGSIHIRHGKKNPATSR